MVRHSSRAGKADPKRRTRWHIVINMKKPRHQRKLDGSILLDDWLAAKHDKTWLKRAVGQLEMAPDTGTLHYQVYLETNSKMYLTALKHVHCLSRAKFFEAGGTPLDNYKYCTKKDESQLEEPWFYPSKEAWAQEEARATNARPKKAKGGTMDVFWNKVRALWRANNGPLTKDQKNELFEEWNDTWVRKKKDVLALEAERFPPKWCDDAKEVIVYYGPANTGKSHRAHRDYPDAYEVMPNSGRQWWDGYDGEETILFDEFRGNLPYGELLSILSGGDLRGEVKGCTVILRHKRVVFTTNVKPEYWYKKLYEEKHWKWEGSPLQTRISKYKQLYKEYKGKNGRKPAKEPLWDSNLGDAHLELIRDQLFSSRPIPSRPYTTYEREEPQQKQPRIINVDEDEVPDTYNPGGDFCEPTELEEYSIEIDLPDWLKSPNLDMSDEEPFRDWQERHSCK